MNLPLLKNAGSLHGKRILLRLDLNLPVTGGKIRDEYRLERSLPTLAFLREQGARTTIVSHTDSKETDSLEYVARRLNDFYPIRFVSEFSKAATAVDEVENGAFLMLENIRRHPGEISNDPVCSQMLASLGDVYVNDAFAVSQRPHASIIGVPKLLPSYAGLLLESEVENLSKAFAPSRPFVFILAGANKKLTKGSNVSATKFPLIKKFLEKADTVAVCGALANDIYKAQGYEVGVSLVSEIPLNLAPIVHHRGLYVPADVVAKKTGISRICGADSVEADEKIVDAGEESLEDLREFISNASLVVWNGPLGEYESGFEKGTVALAQMLAECDAETIIGGGDSLAVVSKLGLLERFSFVSTGGGAMLEFLAKGTLPGISALQQAQNQPSSVISAPYNPSQG